MRLMFAGEAMMAGFANRSLGRSGIADVSRESGRGKDVKTNVLLWPAASRVGQESLAASGTHGVLPRARNLRNNLTVAAGGRISFDPRQRDSGEKPAWGRRNPLSSNMLWGISGRAVCGKLVLALSVWIDRIESVSRSSGSDAPESWRKSGRIAAAQSEAAKHANRRSISSGPCGSAVCS
jgi:hypothetical protein